MDYRTTYDYIGDVIDETVASVDLNAKKNNDGEDFIEHTHTIVIGAKRSDCKTCFDSMEQKILPVSQYTPENILQKSRLAGCVSTEKIEPKKDIAEKRT